MEQCGKLKLRPVGSNGDKNNDFVLPFIVQFYLIIVHQEFLFYYNLLTSGKMNSYLADIECKFIVGAIFYFYSYSKVSI